MHPYYPDNPVLFTAEAGMTWGDYILSDYNSDGVLFEYLGYIATYDPEWNMPLFVTLGYNMMTAADYIMPETVYSLSMPPR